MMPEATDTSEYVSSPKNEFVKGSGNQALNNPSKNSGVAEKQNSSPTDIKDSSSSLASWYAGQVKSAFLVDLDYLSRFLGKQESPFSVALIRHYVEGSGESYDLKNIPIEWQDWIVKTTHGTIGLHKDIDPYNSGLYDLRNSLGHFDVNVTKNADKTKTYAITDTYQFGYKKNDKAQTGRHGFPIGDMDAEKLKLLKALLPDKEYQNPGGFTEKFEIKKIGKDQILFIPQQFLEAQGKKFEVEGSFVK